MNTLKHFASGASMLALVACASHGAVAPRIAYDKAEFQEAVATAEPAPPPSPLRRQKDSPTGALYALAGQRKQLQR